MTDYTLAGPIESALAHLALVGAASILDEADVDTTEGGATFWWADGDEPTAHMATSATPEEVGATIQAHAQRHTEPSSWVQARITGDSRAGGSLFTPRLKPPELSEWPSYIKEREAFLSQAGDDLTDLDWRMLAGLGEPAWWRCNPKESRPDDGASRWEMKTRNRGEEFIVHRLALLAEAVAKRAPAQIWDGLTGATLVDEVGKGKPDSRAATGLTTPSPADNARAWCALWGINALPTIHQSGGMSQSAGSWPRRVVCPERMVLPVFTQPVSVSRYRSIMCSKPFDDAAFFDLIATKHDPATDGMPPDPRASQEWLRGQGIKVLMKFKVLPAGSSSAPERQLLTGSIDAL